METERNTPEISLTPNRLAPNRLTPNHLPQCRIGTASVERRFQCAGLSRRASNFTRLLGTDHRTAICRDWRTGHPLAANCRESLIG